MAAPLTTAPMPPAMHTTQFCHYHREQPATWHCPPCKRLFGDCCTPINADDPKEPACPLCAQRLSYLGAANTAQPFWERIPFFFGYGFQKGPLFFYIAIILLSIVSIKIFPLLLLAVFCIATKYLCTVLVSASEGETEAPPAGEAFRGEGFAIFFKMIGLFFAFGALSSVASNAGLFVMTLTGIVVTLGFPAMIIVLAKENSLLQALNPKKLFSLIQAMGWRYLLLWLFTFILMQSPFLVGGIAVTIMPPMIGAPLLTVILLYFSTVLFAMLGYAVFQYQGALGDVAGDWAAACVPEKDYQLQQAKALSEIYTREGRHTDAIAALKKLLKAQPKNIAMHERYHRLQLAHGQAAQGEQHLFNAYLPLIVQRHPEQATQAYLNAQKRWGNDKPLLPDDAALCEHLAHALLSQKKTAPGMALLSNFHRRFPDYPHVPRAYLLAAHTFAGALNDPVSAKKLLAFIRKRYPDGPYVAKADALEALIQGAPS